VHHGLRLDIALTEILGVSRSQTQTMIADKKVLINQKEPKKAGDRVKTGDTITFSEPVAVTETKAPFGIKKNTPQRTTPIAEVNIIASTPDFIVVEKPSGMLTHPTEAGETNTLANFFNCAIPRAFESW
jgi:23S rRNA-/tRNA-specific pseudouridylate synthase